MINFKKTIIASILLCLSFTTPTTTRDILFEGKGSIFVPTNETFKDVYENSGDFGLEFTGNMFKQLYGFISMDFSFKDGSTIELGSQTKMGIINFGIGAKYFIPFDHGDVYFGLGIEPTYFSTFNDTPELIKQSTWTCGGIAKAGVIFNMPRSFFVDLFFDYSFVKADFYAGTPTQFYQTHLDGCLFGVGIGYRFN